MIIQIYLFTTSSPESYSDDKKRSSNRMSLFTLFECDLCEGKCEKIFDKLPLDEIMEQQILIFNGYMRLEILSHFTQDTNKLIPIDVINLCMKFYQINIKLLLGVDPKFKALSSLAKMCVNNKEYFIAYKLTQLLLTLHPKSAFCHFCCGVVYFRWNMLDEAEELFKQAIELKPDKVGKECCICFYGDVLFKKLQYELAIEQYEKGIEISHDDAFKSIKSQMIRQCAICYVKLKGFDNAQKYYQQAADFEPENAYYKYDYGLFLQSQGKHKDAIIQFEEAIKLEPDKINHIRKCAYSYDKLKDIQNAQKYYQQVVDVKPENGHYRYEYALFLQNNGKHKDAIIQLKEAINLEPDKAKFTSKCAYSYGKLKDADNAHKYHQQAIKVAGKMLLFYIIMVYFCRIWGNINKH